MDNDKLFPTPEKKNQAIIAFDRLRNNPDYQLLCQVVEENIRILTERLATEEFETLQDQKILKVQRQAHVDVINTPEKLIKLFSNVPEESDISFDPYPNSLNEPKG